MKRTSAFYCLRISQTPIGSCKKHIEDFRFYGSWLECSTEFDRMSNSISACGCRCEASEQKPHSVIAAIEQGAAR